MSTIRLYEDDFAYSAVTPIGIGPLRLLGFEPFITSTKLSLSLVDAKQGDKFFAVSYVWGMRVCKPSFGLNRSASCKAHGTPWWTNNKALCNAYLSFYRCAPDGYTDILINGQTFYIQDTVYRFLLAIRAYPEIQQRLQMGERFWLDAICINQNDKDETEQQTSIMHKIYEAAQHVFVWLGTANPSSDVAMDFLYHLAQPQPPTSPQGPWRAQFHSEDHFWPLYLLFTKPYWQRTWVIQECLLARDLTLLCGNRAAPWAKAQTLVSLLNGNYEFRKRHPEWAATPAVKIIQARKEFMSSRMKPSLEEAVQRFLFFRSTYPEDRLIGLLNVSLSSDLRGFNGEPGSLEKRVEVINKVAVDSQGRVMEPQAAQEWRYFLACLLGVQDMFPRPVKSLGSSPALNQPWAQPRSGPPATSMPCTRTHGPRQAHWHPQPFPSTTIAVPAIGNIQFQSPQPGIRPGYLPYGNLVSNRSPTPKSNPQTRIPGPPGFAPQSAPTGVFRGTVCNGL